MATRQENYLHIAHLKAGRLSDARLALLDQRRHWEELSDQDAIAAWFAAMAYLDYLRGCYGSALKDAGYARRLGATPAVALALRVIGCVHLERGNDQAAEQALADCLQVAIDDTWAVAAADLGLARGDIDLLTDAANASAGSPAAAWATAKLARGLGKAERPADAAASLERAHDQVQGHESGFAWIQVGLAEAELEQAAGRPSAALGASDSLIARLSREGVRSHLGDAMLVRAAALRALGRQEEATAALSAVHELALCLGSGRLLAALQ